MPDDRLTELRRKMDLNKTLSAIRDKRKLWVNLEHLTEQEVRDEWTILAGLFSELDEALKAGAELPNDWKRETPKPEPTKTLGIPDDPTHDPH